MSGEDRIDADPALSTTLLEEATAIARRRRDGRLLALVATARFMRGIGVGDDDELVGLTEPLDLLPRRATERIELLGAAAAMVSFSRPSVTADRLFEQVEALADELDDPRIELVRLITACVVGSRHAMPFREIDSMSRKALDLAEQLDDPMMRLVALHARLLADLAGCDLDAVERLAALIGRAGREALAPFGMQRHRLLRHALALARGELDGAGRRDRRDRRGRQEDGRRGDRSATGPDGHRWLELGDQAKVLDLVGTTAGEHEPPTLSIVRVMALAEAGPDERSRRRRRSRCGDGRADRPPHSPVRGGSSHRRRRARRPNWHGGPDRLPLARGRQPHSTVRGVGWRASAWEP